MAIAVRERSAFDVGHAEDGPNSGDVGKVNPIRTGGCSC
jgi:hypothetical protein